MRYAVIDSSNNVVNIIKWDGESQWSPPKGHIALSSYSAQIGQIYDPLEETFSNKSGE